MIYQSIRSTPIHTQSLHPILNALEPALMSASEYDSHLADGYYQVEESHQFHPIQLEDLDHLI